MDSRTNSYSTLVHGKVGGLIMKWLTNIYNPARPDAKEVCSYETNDHDVEWEGPSAVVKG